MPPRRHRAGSARGGQGGARAAKAAPREYQVFQTDHPPFIDGDVRDDVWRAVPWSGDFTGLQGAAADVQTQFAMAWDEKFLYVAVRCKEPRPEAIHAEITGRDPRIVNDDHIEILLASPDKPAACLLILLNPAGGRAGQWTENGRPVNAPEDRWLRLQQAGLDSAVAGARQRVGDRGGHPAAEHRVPAQGRSGVRRQHLPRPSRRRRRKRRRGARSSATFASRPPSACSSSAAPLRSRRRSSAATRSACATTT